MHKFFILILGFCLSSCKHENDIVFREVPVVQFSCPDLWDNLTKAEMLLGKWVYVVDDRLPIYVTDMERKEGYEFLDGGICHYMQGFYDWNHYQSYKQPGSPHNDSPNFIRYLGTKTEYKFDDDTLNIYNPGEETWADYPIAKLTQDTLKIIRQDHTATFVKQCYNTDIVPDFDAVIVSSSPCFGVCPVGNTLIDKEGNVFFVGGSYTDKEGYYEGRISKAEVLQIQEAFKKADYMNLKSTYSTPVTCSRTIDVSFIKDGKIIKSVSDYASSGPPEFVWAYLPITELWQKAPLKKVDYPSYDYFGGAFRGRKEYYFLTDAERFYLQTFVLKGRETTEIFKQLYTVDWFDSNNKVVSDGRYFKFTYEDGSTKTIDIGMNFITDNKLVTRFVKN